MTAAAPATTLPPPENKLHYPALDGLRALAVLVVFLQHYILVTHRRLVWGWAGVDIFFVLSGFLITGILYDTRNAPHRVRNFYGRRTLRIFPLYYGILLVILLAALVLHAHTNPSWGLWPIFGENYSRILFQSLVNVPYDPLNNLIVTHDDHTFRFFLGHFWSLCVEEQFYLLWAPVVFLVRDRIRLRNLCLVIIPLVLAARCARYLLTPAYAMDSLTLYHSTCYRADALLIGALIALTLRGPGKDRLLRLGQPAFKVGAALFLVAVVACALLGLSPDASTPFMATIGVEFIDLLAAALLITILVPGNLAYRALTNPVLQQLGKISFGFYVFHDLFHEPIMLLILKANGHHAPPGLTYLTAAVAFVLTIVLSTLSFRYFETPFLRLKRLF